MNTTTPDPSPFLEAALTFISKSRETIKKFDSTRCAREIKSDQSFVTEADTAAERVLRESIQAHYPDHAIFGEEYSGTEHEQGFLWTIDPIDGTQNFVHGIPTYGTILALRYNGVSIVGVVDHPALGLTYYAKKGGGAFCNGEKISIHDSAPSEKLDINEIIITSTRGMFERSSEGGLLDAFMKVHPATRIYYDVFATTQVVHGHAGALIEFNVALWDIAATKLLIEEAGGSYEQVRTWRDSKGVNRYSAIFGKPSVVKKLLPYFRSNHLD